MAVTVSLLPATPSRAEVLSFAPSADAFVRADRPTRNWGGATQLKVDGSPTIDTLLRFSVSGVGNRGVSGATLRLHAVAGSVSGGDFFSAAASGWTEAGVTWATAPQAESFLGSLDVVRRNRSYEIDLTGFVAGDGDYAIRITSTSSDGVAYGSREAGGSQRPQLVVTTDPVPDTTPPSVSVQEPAAGASVSGVVTVVVDATDDVGIASVELTAGFSPVGTDASPPYEFSWNTVAEPNGPIDLVARARDTSDNVTDSAPVQVWVDNVEDTGPPTAPTGLEATSVQATSVELSWTGSADDVGVDHYEIHRDGGPIGTSPGTTFVDPSVAPQTSYTYVVVAVDAAENTSDPSETVSVTTPARGSIVFAAAGDHAANVGTTTESLARLDASEADFYLALGDLDYDQTPTDEAWCDFVLSHLPTKGPGFPFELVAGNHEEEGGPDGYILNHAACLPDRLGATVGPGSTYGAEYYIDYPAADPLIRVVMISPRLTIGGTTYDYASGTVHGEWLAGVIDAARAGGIPWVAVGMHYPCLTMSVSGGCSMGGELWNLLVEKRVDLVLHGHSHNYQRTKQLALDPVTCPSIPVTGYEPGCVVDDGSDGVYPKGTGTVDVIAGTFGQSLKDVDPGDPEAPYFVEADGTTWGYVEYSVSADRIDARFVNARGTFTDSFSIVAGATAAADRVPPTTPTGLAATVVGDTRVDLSWLPSSDDVEVERYGIFRDGVRVGISTEPMFSDIGAIPGTVHTYHVVAYDAAGNRSAPSESVTVAMPGAGAAATFLPVADATVKVKSPSSNYGSAPSLEVDNSPVKDVLLRFTVTGVGQGTVTSAKLRLYCLDPSTSGGTFRRVDDHTWSEDTVTWDSAPAADPVPVASLGGVSAGSWYEVDLTSLITGDGTFDLRISSDSSNGADYASKEGLGGSPPTLVVAYQPA